MDQLLAAERDVQTAEEAGDVYGITLATVRAETAWSRLASVSPRGRVERFRLDGGA